MVKELAGGALIALVLLVSVGGPSYGTSPSTKGLPSQTEGQTDRAGEWSRTQKEGGKNGGASYGRLQSEYIHPNAELTGLFNRNDHRPTSSGTGTKEILGRVQSGKAAEQSTKHILEGGSRQAAKAYEPLDNPIRANRSNSRGVDNVLGDFLVTAYTAGPESTGKSPGDKGYGEVAVSTPTKKVLAREGHTISADWRVLPPGTVVEIEGLPGTYTVEDNGGGIRGNHIDLFMPKLKAALEWGRQYREIRVLKEG